MGFFDRFKNNKQTFTEVVSTTNPLNEGAHRQNFSTPFLNIGKGDLTKPFISSNYVGSGGYVRFGEDNMFPQIINQMYYTSPLLGGIIQFKTSAVCGGGFEIQNTPDNLKSKIELKAFIKKNKLKKLVPTITRDWVMHETVYFILEFGEDGIAKTMKRISPEKVRLNETKTQAFISDDWYRARSVEVLPIYNGDKNGRCVYMYQSESPGQDTYAIPMYTNCFNWCFLDGESSLLHKSNIQESIFPSMVIKRPKRFANDEEAEKFQDALTNKKGANDAGFLWVLTADSPELLPQIDTIQTSGNDKLMMQTDERMDSRICMANQIDPLIMGIRVSGKLGSGQEAQNAYLTFEKNWVLPNRNVIEEIFNDLLDLSGIEGDFVLVNYQLVAGQIFDKTEDVDNTEDNNLTT
jgi:hypothetical protein